MNKLQKLSKDFYSGTDVLGIARELLGKILVSRQDGYTCSGRIVELEAYAGISDKASHAYGGRRTNRTEIMYASGGVAYVYLCYGIHHLFNVVTGEKDTPHAILIRALEPLEGTEKMLQRTGRKKADHTLMSGPGRLSKALGIHKGMSGQSLLSGSLFITDDGFRPAKNTVLTGPRIGVEYAGADALLPYRFYLKGHAAVSRR